MNTQNHGDAGATEAKAPELPAPELLDAGDAHQHAEEAEAPEPSEPEAPGLTEEQRRERKTEKRIDRLTAKRYEAQARAEQAERQLEEMRRRYEGADSAGNGTEGEPRLTRADVDRLANERARELQQRSEIGKRVGKVLEDGAKLEGFNAAVDAVAKFVPFADRNGKPTPFIEAVLDTDDPAAMLKYLGDDPDEAEDLADLNPGQLGRRLAKLEEKLKRGAKRQTSAAPTPLKPVTGGTNTTPDEAKMTDAEWRAQRFKRG